MLPRESVEYIASLGYRVFMRDPSDTYAYFSDGTRIGYVEHDRMAGFTISTVHMPSRDVGTGYQVSRHGPLTSELLEEAIRTHTPAWDRRNSSAVLKYRDLDQFLASSTWNAGFVEQPAKATA